MEALKEPGPKALLLGLLTTTLALIFALVLHVNGDDNNPVKDSCPSKDKVTREVAQSCCAETRTCRLYAITLASLGIGVAVSILAYAWPPQKR